jgi:hypothetical protein
MFCILLCSALLAVVGCSGTGEPVDVLLDAANSQLTKAQEAGAPEYARPEFDEASDLLAEARMALETKDKGARVLIERAYARARLAEALAKQSKSENEATQLEAELEKALMEANRARKERQSAESELAQGSVDEN